MLVSFLLRVALDPDQTQSTAECRRSVGNNVARSEAEECTLRRRARFPQVSPPLLHEDHRCEGPNCPIGAWPSERYGLFAPLHKPQTDPSNIHISTFEGQNLRKAPLSHVSFVSAPLKQSRVGLYGDPGLAAMLIPCGKHSRHASSKSPSSYKRSRLVIDSTFALLEVATLYI